MQKQSRANIKRIGIDCRLAGQENAGIGRYIENLIIWLPKLAPEINWIFFFLDEQQAQTIIKKIRQNLRLKDDQALKNVNSVITHIRHYSLAEQFKLPPIFQQANLDLLHIPHFNISLLYQGKIVVTIHDLLWHKQKGPEVTTLPAWKYWLKYLAYRLVCNQAIKKAEIIFVPAETIKNEVLSYYPYSQKKIVVSKEGISQAFLAEYQRIKKSNFKILNDKIAWLNKQKIKQLIYTGSLYPHKNLEFVIKTLPELPDFTLKIVSSRKIFQEKLKKISQNLGLEKRVIFVNNLADEELVKEYRYSYALIQPSLSEGFGLTGVEAIACGLPVIASDIPIFKEIYADVPIYFDPKQKQSLIKAINLIKPIPINLITSIIDQYSWEKMTRLILKMY